MTDTIPLHKSDCALLIGGYQCTCGFHQRQNKTPTALAAEQPKPARLHATTTGVLLGSAWLVWNTPVGANDEIMSQETADLLNRNFADAEALRRDAERYRWMKQEVKRIPPGWDLVGWDAAIDAAMKEDKT